MIRFSNPPKSFIDFTKYCVCTKDHDVSVSKDGGLICDVCNKIHNWQLQNALWNIEDNYERGAITIR